MKQVNVIIEKTDTGYSAFSPDIDGCAATGQTIEEAKEQYAEALEFHREGIAEDGDPMPEVLQGDYGLNFTMDLPSFFAWMDGKVTKTGIANISGLNRDLVNHYANGHRKPSAKQLLKIQKSLHEFGNEISQVKFV